MENSVEAKGHKSSDPKALPVDGLFSENDGITTDLDILDDLPARSLGDGMESEIDDDCKGNTNASSGHSDESQNSTVREGGKSAVDLTFCLLPWGAPREVLHFPASIHVETDLRPGEFVMRTLFAEFTVIAEKKIENILQEPLERSLSKSLQRGEDLMFDQLISAFGLVAEQCLPSLLNTLFAWYDRQCVEEWGTTDLKFKQDLSKSKSSECSLSLDRELMQEKRDLAVEFIFCLVLIEVLKQFAVHPGHDVLVKQIEDIAFRHFKYREGLQNNPNGANINTVADLYAEVIGVLAQSRFQSVRRRFMTELKELRAKESCSHTTQSIISLLVGMKFFRIKMVPIEEFEASFQYMQECAQYFLEVRDKDIKHALAGLFVEILAPVAATVKNEVNVPCLKNFVDLLYSTTLDTATKKNHRLAMFPLVTCLLCVSQKNFFLSNWHYFLAMCLQHLKNRDQKMSRVALESLYRLLWVYMIRIKCESNSATHSRLASIVNSFFPKGSKAVVPRDTPLNIFVKIIQFIAQERLDFAMREIIFDLLSVGRQIKFILTPERMSIGLRAFLVVADSLQQKEGDPPMPRTVAVLPSGNTLRVKKTFLNKTVLGNIDLLNLTFITSLLEQEMLTEDTARNIGISAYYLLVRKSFNDILKALDSQFGKPLMMTNNQNVNKEPDEMITGERKPKIDLFRTCVAAIPRLIPDGMSGQDLVDMLARLTVHMDEELRGLSFQSLQNLVLDFPEWRNDVLYGFILFLVKEVGDTYPQLVEKGLRMVLQLLTAWKNAVTNTTQPVIKRETSEFHQLRFHYKTDHFDMLHFTEGFALVMLCSYQPQMRKIACAILKEVKLLVKALGDKDVATGCLIDSLDNCCSAAVEKISSMLPAAERINVASVSNIDIQWLVERTYPIWSGTFSEEMYNKDGTFIYPAGSVVWASLLCAFMEDNNLQTYCSQALAHAWPIAYTRSSSLYSVIDPVLPNENRASLLRSTSQVKKPGSERDTHVLLWRNYVVLACRVVPAILHSQVARCASPDISLSSSPDSGSASERSVERLTAVSPQCLYKILVPLLRCEDPEVREAATFALGKINHRALGDLMEELVPYIRECIDRKQENMRRRKRRDLIRMQLIKLFEMIAEQGTFAHSETVIDVENGSLHKHYLEYIDGARLYLETEVDKDNTLQLIKTVFCSFIVKLIKSFTPEHRMMLLPRNIRRHLFRLFIDWSHISFDSKVCDESVQLQNDLEFSALNASCAVLCCGSCFDQEMLSDEGKLYPWLDKLLLFSVEKIQEIVEETIVLLLEFNPDSGFLLDWVVDRCYTAEVRVADLCFTALATIFSAREYPCDHYTAIMNVTLLNTGCPRAGIHETALQLLQILDKRFFGTISPLAEADGNNECSTLDVLLSSSYSRSQLYLSKQLAQLHPELTMPMFSEITFRLQTARVDVRQLLFQCLLLWLFNMELVDPCLPSAITGSSVPLFEEIDKGVHREGWGSAEATEMVLNNLFYITARFGDENPKEIEDLWAALSTCWPNNLKVIIRYLFIITGMAAQELLVYAKRVVVYVGRARPDQLVEELIIELGTVETFNCVIERTETPPFFRLTSMRKTSSHGESSGIPGSSNTTESAERGTIHTKRHSDHQDERYGKEQHSTPGSLRSVSSLESNVSSVIANDPTCIMSLSLPVKPKSSLPSAMKPSFNKVDNFSTMRSQSMITEGVATDKDDISSFANRPEPHPLPMPEYGGYFAPLTEYLPDSSLPVTAFHRCYLAVMLLCDVIVAGIDVECQSIDWPIHVPLMLHIATLGLDHARPLVFQHCKNILINLLMVVADHHDHIGVAGILLNNKTKKAGYGLVPQNIFVYNKSFTEEAPSFSLASEKSAPEEEEKEEQVEESEIEEENETKTDEVADELSAESEEDSLKLSCKDDQMSESGETEVPVSSALQFNIKALIAFLASCENVPLWNYEDITSKELSIRSADQLGVFIQHIILIFNESLPSGHIEERLAQVALHLALSCSSRHYATRSLQVFRSLRVSLSSRMLSELLSRLVETVAEQGEDMQGYVTELMLTLEAAVDALHSDFRPIEFVRELFKSTPNLNNKEHKGQTHFSSCSHCCPFAPVSQGIQLCGAGGHFRSTSYSVSYGKVQGMRGRSGTDAEYYMKQRNLNAGHLSRSRSAQSLKHLIDQNSFDDKMTVLAQLFWISISMLESDYEYEFMLALRLLDKVLSRLSLDRPDCREKIEKIQQQLKWKEFPGIHALLLKGCTSLTTYEMTVRLLSAFTQVTDLLFVDPSQEKAFPTNVIALLPYMLLHYEDANALCIQASENIAQMCNKKRKELENLATVMTLYSRRNFNKESFQWTKCVIKYLHDSYAFLMQGLMGFLVEVLEKGPASVQLPVLNILHCMLHYVDFNSSSFYYINSDVLRVVAKYLEGIHYKEALKILKLAVTRSSSLVVPPSSHSNYWESQFFTDLECGIKKELPGRTMEFTFDVAKTPVIGRKYLYSQSSHLPTLETIVARMTEGSQEKDSSNYQRQSKQGSDECDSNSLCRSSSLTAADVAQLAGWKRPWLSQVIFSQSSELERQSSVASSSEELPGALGDQSNDRTADDVTFSEKQFAVFKDFDFLEYELESQGEESVDNFNLWRVRRRSPSDHGEVEECSHQEDKSSEPSLSLIKKPAESGEPEWWDRTSLSPFEDTTVSSAQATSEFSQNVSAKESSAMSSPKLNFQAVNIYCPSSPKSDSDDSSDGDPGEMTPCNVSPSITTLMFRPFWRPNSLDDTWQAQLMTLMAIDYTVKDPYISCCIFNAIFSENVSKFSEILSESTQYLVDRGNDSVNSFRHFVHFLEVINDYSPLPYVYIDSPLLDNSAMCQKFRSTFIALHEHFDTYMEKFEAAVLCLERMKSTVKLQSLGGNLQDFCPDEQQIELCKILCKLHFQFFIIYDSYIKLISQLVHGAVSLQLCDHSNEVNTLRNTLLVAAEHVLMMSSAASTQTLTPLVLVERELPEGEEESEADTSTGLSLDSSSQKAMSESTDTLKPDITVDAVPSLVQAQHQVLQYVANQNWIDTVEYVQKYRQAWKEMPASEGMSDIDIILNIYCSYLSDKMPGMIAVCGTEAEFTEKVSRLTDSNMSALRALQSIENSFQVRDTMESAMRKTEC